MESAYLNLLAGLPDPNAAKRFLDTLAEKRPADHAKLLKNPGLLSDVAAIVSFSPLLATTILQNPGYLSWLDRKRKEEGVRTKEELLESLARFALTNSTLEPEALYARFRRRELLRIFLRDVRRLATIAEITEEISNLADAILESALRRASQDAENRYGIPLESDSAGRAIPARICVVALGKLGSRELNYSSDIDLLFVYSSEGKTSGSGAQGSLTNREYFIKIAELTTRLAGGQSSEGAAYRVDLRLRPHGTMGALAWSVDDMVRYYKTAARPWERQALIRSRGCAGDTLIFRQMFNAVEDEIFSRDQTVESALDSVRRSREQINFENRNRPGFDVKLGAGGIREIEFISQALQLAYGGSDRWLRATHTLVSLSRLADRGHLNGSELSELSAAYDLLRRTEHVLQMENGLQTHTVPTDKDKRALLFRRMKFAAGVDLEQQLAIHTANVSRIYSRVFKGSAADTPLPEQKIEHTRKPVTPQDDRLEYVRSVSPHFGAIIDANPDVAKCLSKPKNEFNERDYHSELLAAVSAETGLKKGLAALRQSWTHFLLDIAVRDIFLDISIAESKRLQTKLGEASIAAALKITGQELARKLGSKNERFRVSVLALGKLGGRALDYNSDLDLLLVYDDGVPCPAEKLSHAEFYSRAVEIFVNTLSAVTRDGHLYRVDLRLRPYGSKGLGAIPQKTFIDYMLDTAAIWEMLAFVKLRAVGGEMEMGSVVEEETRKIIHTRAMAVDPAELKNETRRVRFALEKQRARIRRGDDIDIKYGAGGLLDVYFATRYLQLRDNIPDTEESRSTGSTLDRLRESKSIAGDEYTCFTKGYEFLSALDHNLRLTIGRTTRLPTGDRQTLSIIAKRIGLDSPAGLLEQLTIYRLSIREAFDTILGV